MAKGKALELSIQIAGRVDQSLISAIGTVQNKISGLSKNLSRIGTVGLAAMGGLAAGAMAAIADCTNEAVQFESNMSNVVKYVDGLADSSGKISDKTAGNGKTFSENYGEMKAALLDLSTQIPMTAEELTQLAAAAGQSGKGISDLVKFDSKGNITGFLKDAAMMGTAMDISAEQAGDWAAKWEVAFGMNHDQIMVLADQINYLGANSATTAAEIAQVVNDAASLGQIGGLHVSTTAALADAVLAMGVDSGKAATSISRIISNMSLGTSATKQQKEAWESLGFTAAGVARDMQRDSIGTMKNIFTAIGNIDEAKQVAVLKTLFGQWAIQGAAKLTGNLKAFTDALDMVNDPSKYKGSMEREFTIKAANAESIDKMMESAKYALKVEVGDSFLPVKKQFSLAMIGLMNTLRRNMPELSQIADTLAGLFSGGLEKAGDALEKALPYVQKVLDYVANNGPQVISVLGGIAAALAALKFAPAFDGILGGIGGLFLGDNSSYQVAGNRKNKSSGGLLGTVKNLWDGGQTAAQGVKTVFGIGKQSMDMDKEDGGGFFSRLGAGAAGLFSGFRNMGGLTSPKIIKRDAAWNSINKTVSGVRNYGLFGSLWNHGAKTKTGQYFGDIEGSIGKAFGILKKTSAGQWGAKHLSAIGGGLGSGLKEAFPIVLGGIADSGLVKGVKGGAGWIAQKGLSAVNTIASSKPIQTVAGTVGTVVHSAPVQAIGGLLGGSIELAGGLAKGGTGILGSIWGPLLSGFGSLFTGIAPVIGVISGIIAVVSILGDHLEDIRGVVQKVFGDQGLAVFDKFTEKLGGIGQFISGLFRDGGVANALAPLRGMFGKALGGGGFLSTLFGGTESGLAAFDGAVQILQSIMGVIGQLVSFSTGTVKPIIQDVFGFLTGTVLPVILQAFTATAPEISGIISGLGTAVMTGMQVIGMAVQAALPIVKGLITHWLQIARVVVPAVLAGMNVMASGISSVITSVKGIFQGIIDFIKGVFTLDWKLAWTGVKEIFGNIFSGLSVLIKTPINAVIALVNKAISGINGLGLDIPEWVPGFGGQKFSLNIPQIPMLAKGGFTSGPSIAGEAGQEAVISFQSGVRASNINTWMKAGRMLGVDRVQAAQAAGPSAGIKTIGEGFRQPMELKEVSGTGSGDREFSLGDSPVQFIVNITIQGSADKNTITEAMSEAESRFRVWFEQWFEERRRREKRLAY